MAYVPVPKDLSKIKTKVMLNLTRRQLICFGCGILIGIPMFITCKPYIGVSTATLLMIFSMLPFFLFAMYEKNGQPLEKLIYNIIQVRFIRPKYRPYKTNNFYAAIGRQIQLDKEVPSIVQKSADPAPASRKAAKGRNLHVGQKEGDRSIHSPADHTLSTDVS